MSLHEEAPRMSLGSDTGGRCRPLPGLSDLANLADEDALVARLRSALDDDRERGSETRDRVLVGVAVPGRAAYAATPLVSNAKACANATASAGARTKTKTNGATAVNARSRRMRQRSAAERCVPAGCLAKLLTSALALRACAEGRLALDTPLAAVLPAARALAGITLRHLLEHRHGLDDSALAAAPYRSDGFIAATALAARLAPARLAAPGVRYSYSNAGAWLTAAALEHTSGRRYGTLLAEFLEQPPPLRPPCPALGRSLAVPVGALLELARRHAPWTRSLNDGAGEPVAALPGWNPFERGVCLGWKHYGDGWVGHNSVWPGASSILRVEPRSGVAIFVASADEPAAVWAARLFGASLPDLVGPQMPKVTRPSAATASTERYVGLYRSAALSACIEQDRNPRAALTLEATSVRGRRFGRRALRPYADHLFFVDPPDAATFSFVQLIEPCGAGFRYLWNGRFLLRNAAYPLEAA
jgi:CubicO group peptidase (beta-lactamase class C family)